LHADTTEIRLAEDAGVSCARRKRGTGHPMTRGRRPTRDAANAITGCSHPDHPEARSTRDPADELTADETRGN
jgi:hypothetical protein